MGGWHEEQLQMLSWRWLCTLDRFHRAERAHVVVANGIQARDPQTIDGSLRAAQGSLMAVLAGKKYSPEGLDLEVLSHVLRCYSCRGTCHRSFLSF